MPRSGHHKWWRNGQFIKSAWFCLYCSVQFSLYCSEQVLTQIKANGKSYYQYQIRQCCSPEGSLMGTRINLSPSSGHWGTPEKNLSLKGECNLTCFTETIWYLKKIILNSWKIETILRKIWSEKKNNRMSIFIISCCWRIVAVKDNLNDSQVLWNTKKSLTF